MSDARVGPVLVADEIGRVVAEVIAADNPGTRVVDRGAYLRVEAPGRCTLDATAVADALGRAFVLPRDLELVMTSFSGRLRFAAEQASWEADR